MSAYASNARKHTLEKWDTDSIVAEPEGYIYYVSAEGNIETLADMHLEKQDADIGYDPVKCIVFVPTLKAGTVAAYRLN